MQTTGPSVYDFDNYRTYMLAVLQSRKERNNRFSIGAWSARLEMKSSSGLIMILNGDRNPSVDLTEKIILDLKLRSNEADYFRDLISYEKARDSEHVQALLRAKLAKRHPQKEFKPMETKVFKAISEWYYDAIRELADLPDFQEDAAWIQSRLRLPLPKPRIEETLRILEELDLLRRDENGRLRYTGNATTSFDVPHEAIKVKHEQFLEISRNSLRTVAPEDREISGTTFTCKKEDLPKIKEKIRELIFGVVGTSDREHDSVFRLQISCVPLTEDPEK